MKVKLICNATIKTFEQEVNDFIKDKKIIDIKFSETGEETIYPSVLIMYEEKQ